MMSATIEKIRDAIQHVLAFCVDVRCRPDAHEERMNSLRAIQTLCTPAHLDIPGQDTAAWCFKVQTALAEVRPDKFDVCQRNRFGEMEPVPLSAQVLNALGVLKEAQNELWALANIGTAEHPKRKQRKTPPRASRKLTSNQLEAMQIVGENKGNIQAAANQIGITRQAMAKRYQTAIKKLAAATGESPKKIKARTQRLPTDERGQAFDSLKYKSRVIRKPL